MVSSAKSRTWLVIESGKSLMYSKKIHGPSTEPWGTPDRTGQDEDSTLFTTTFWLRFRRKFLIQEIIFELMSNAFWNPSLLHLFVGQVPSCCRCQRWRLEVVFDSYTPSERKPCCRGRRRLCLSTWTKILLVMMCSITLLRMQVILRFVCFLSFFVDRSHIGFFPIGWYFSTREGAVEEIRDYWG